MKKILIHVLLMSVLIVWRSDLSNAKKIILRTQINRVLISPDDFNWLPSPAIYIHTPTSNEWTVAEFRKDQFKAGITAAKIAEIKAKVDSVAGLKLEFTTNSVQLLKDNNLVPKPMPGE